MSEFSNLWKIKIYHIYKYKNIRTRCHTTPHTIRQKNYKETNRLYEIERFIIVRVTVGVRNT